MIAGERVTLRPAGPDDAEALLEILREPEVACWWGDNDLAGVRTDIEGLETYVIEVEGATAGWLHVVEENEPDYRHAGIDIALTTRLRSASSRSACCGPTNAGRTARGATGC